MGQNRSNQFLLFDEYQGINLSEDWVQHLEQNLISKLLLFVPVLLPLFPPPLDYVMSSYPMRVIMILF